MTDAWLHRFSAVVFLALGILAIATITLAGAAQKRHKWLSRPLAMTAGIFVVIAVVTFSAATIFLTVRSPQHAPVSWKAGIEFWACGTKLTLQDAPKGMATKIGTIPYFYENSTETLRYEGIPNGAQPSARLGNFMTAIGGSISDEAVQIPLTNTPENTAAITALVEKQLVTINGKTVGNFVTGKSCDGTQPAQVQVFVISASSDGHSYTQQKITNPADYVISPANQVPNGDCLIVEFDQLKAQTEHLCPAYGKRDALRCQQYGVPVTKQETCDMQQAYMTGGEL